MGFLGRIIKPLVENAFDRMQSEAMVERLKEQDKQASKVLSLFPIQELFNCGPMANLNATFTSGIQVARTELSNELARAFAPLTRDVAAFTGGVRNLFEDFFFENRAGGLIGTSIGQALGFLAGFILPGGPLVWSQLFGAAGGFLGTFVQGSTGPADHPPIPGTPGDPALVGSLPGDTELPSHVQDLINNALANPPDPVIIRQQVRLGGHRI